MKKISFAYILILLGLVFNSCNEEIEIWDSNVLDYSGRFVVELQSEDQSSVYYDYHDGLQIDIFNTSENVANMLWIEDNDEIPLKSKFSIEGNSLSFKSKSLLFEDLYENLRALELPTSIPDAADLTTTVDRDYIKSGIVEAKVLPMAATTLGGNIADSIYVKVLLKSGSVTFVSYLLPAALRVDPEKDEFAWKVDVLTYDDTLDETMVISGHRYTGFSEDSY